MSSFVAVDFETANHRRESPCAVGAVKVVDDQVVAEWETLIDPETDEFANTWVHGIAPEDVVGAPRFPEALRQLLTLTEDTTTIVAHNASFDVQVMTSSAARYGMDLEIQQFACTMVLARKWFPGLPTYSLGYLVHRLELLELCGDGGHHNAMWDARGSAHIALSGLRQAGLNTWKDAADAAGVSLGRASASAYNGCVTRWSGEAIRPVRDPEKEIDPENPLYGVKVAFTGTLSHLSRRDAAQLVVDAGGEFSQNMTSTTDLLVVGRQDLDKLAGHTSSAKMRKAEKMAAEGHHIEVIDEMDFQELIGR